MPEDADSEIAQGKRAVLVIVGGMVLAIALFFGAAAIMKHEANTRPEGAPPPPTAAPSPS